MKKSIKIIVISILVILLTGCSGNYNLIINNDLSISEEVDLSINNENDAYQKSLNIFEENNIEKNKYNVVIVDNEVRINYKDNFSSIEDYILNSKVYHQLFDRIQYNKNEAGIDLYINENLRLKNNYNILNGTNLNDLGVIQVNVTNPFKVIDTNAEIVTDKIYTWTIKTTDVEKIINMKFKSVLDVFPYKAVILGIVIFIIIITFGIILFKKYKKVHRF